MKYDSSKRDFLPLEEIRAIFRYRDLISQLIYRDIVTRYKRSVLGVAWTMIHPLGIMLVLTIVFSQVFNTVEGYPVYVLSGLIAWTFFSQATVGTLQQTLWGGSLFHRIYLPRTTFAISAIGTGLVNVGLSMLPLILIMLIVRIPVRPSIFFAAISIFILGAFALGMGLIVSALALNFPDVVEMYQVILTAWMYLTPIIYPIDVIPESYRQWMVALNPMYYFVEIFRQPIYQGSLPPWNILVISCTAAIFTLLLGWILFTSKVNELTYRV